MSMPPASSRSSLPCLGVSRLVLKPVALSRNSSLRFETPRTVSGPLTSSRSPQPHVVTSSFVSTPVALVQHPSSYSSFPISVSNKNVENHLTSIKKKADPARGKGASCNPTCTSCLPHLTCNRCTDPVQDLLIHLPNLCGKRSLDKGLPQSPSL